MDNKQTRIFNNILDKNKLPRKNVFIQHRNLTEFKSFRIERINPTHRIFLYGKLKKKHINDGHFDKTIKAGEILLCFGLFFFVNTMFMNFVINIMIGAILLSFYLDVVLNVDWNRGECRNRKNALSCAMST